MQLSLCLSVCPQAAYISELNKVLALKKPQSGVKSAPALCNDSCHCPTELQGFCVFLPSCLQRWQGQGWAGHAEIVFICVGPKGSWLSCCLRCLYYITPVVSKLSINKALLGERIMCNPREPIQAVCAAAGV